MLKSLTKLDYKAHEVQHALMMKTALLHGNYSKFFRLRQSIPNMGNCLLDIFLPNLRFVALLKLFNS